MKKVILLLIYLLFYFNIELCCAYCHFKNLHPNHKILELSDIKSIEKENISIESSTKEFGQIIENITSLKNKIEKEINNINNLYEKTIKDLTKSFLEKHEKLIKDENEIKEKLQNEVTKVKEKLENFYSEINNQIKINERIQQGIKKFEKEEKNMIKILSYVSKINKNNKEMKRISQELMKSIKFYYEEKENNIKYDEYYFNGLAISSKNILFKDINYNSLNMSWEIDNTNDIDINKIKYKVEIKKENEEYIKIYEGNNKNCLIDKLEKYTNYEIRICPLYNEYIGPWTQIQKIKTKELDSIILKESKRGKEFYQKMLEWTGYKNMELLYRGSRDGSKSTDFHSKCDNQGPTITLFKNEKGYIFGGYASISWTNNGSWQTANDCFIFTLTNIHKTEPTKFNRNINNIYGVLHGTNYGPYFGGGPNVGCYENYLTGDSSSSFTIYQDNLGKGISIFTGDLNNNNSSYKIKEVEVFKLFK